MSDGDLEDQLCSHAAHLAVAECRLVLMVGEVDRRGIWADQGLRSCAHWLNWRCGVSLPAAREQVRVGRALAGLPLLAAAFGEGRLSYSKVRAITRVADRTLEASLVDLARYTTASQLERIVREFRRADPDEGTAALRRHAGRYLRATTDADGMVVISARLSPEDGAVVLAAIEAARREMEEDRSVEAAPGVAESVSAETSAGVDPAHPCPVSASGPSEGPEGHAASAADALVAMCESSLVKGVDPAGEHAGVASVLVHVDDRVLRDPAAEGCAHIQEVGAISSHTAQRLVCDAAVADLHYRDDGTVVPEGRTRRVPKSLRRAVLARDRGCRFPGCTQRRFVDVHHVRFVSHQGRTVLSNLTSICRFHHRLVHEGGFRLEMDPTATVRVFSPSGDEIPAAPVPPPAGDPDLAEQHRRAGLDVSSGTLSYCGEPFDLPLTIDVLLWNAGKMG